MKYIPKHDLHIKLIRDNGKTPFRVSDCSELIIKVFTSSRKHYLKFGFDDVVIKDDYDILVIPAIVMKTLKSGVIQYEIEYQKEGNEDCWFAFTIVTEIYLKNPYYEQTEEDIENGSLAENILDIQKHIKYLIDNETDYIAFITSDGNIVAKTSIMTEPSNQYYYNNEIIGVWDDEIEVIDEITD